MLREGCSTLNYNSAGEYIKSEDGSIFYSILEDARAAIPVGAVRLAVEPDGTTVEVWQDK